MRLLVKNIGKIVGIETAGRLRLCGGEMDRLETLDDAWLLADDGRIAAFGRMETLGEMAADRTVDAEGGMLFPSFCDSHTHLVYAGSREQEFLDKINGLSYEEIARRGGGILNSADLLHETSEEELYAQAMERVREIAAKGTGCVEIKSGYGLTTEDELKMLRVIRRIRGHPPPRGPLLEPAAAGNLLSFHPLIESDMSLFALFFGLMSGCFLSVLVGIVGSKRRIGFGWAFLASLLLTPLVGLLLALISDPLPVGTDRGLGCIGTLFGVLGLLFLVAFLFLLLAGGMLVAM